MEMESLNMCNFLFGNIFSMPFFLILELNLNNPFWDGHCLERGNSQPANAQSVMNLQASGFMDDQQLSLQETNSFILIHERDNHLNQIFMCFV